MKIHTKYTGLLILMLSVAGLFTACNKNDNEELLVEHDKDMQSFKTEYGIQEKDSIGDGIYLKITSDTTGINKIYARTDDYVVVDLYGVDPDGNVFDITDEDKADSLNIYRGDLIYGPRRIKVDESFSGFYKAIRKLPEGAEAIMLFPYDQAFGGYLPVLYKVKLHRVISDISAYTAKEFEAYREKLEIGPEDIFSDVDSIYYKITGLGDTGQHEITYGDIVTILLTARYAEIDTAYVDGFPGREFFPINNSGDSILFEYGQATFPITQLVHSAVGNMKIGETWEILSPANYAYGDYGFRHPRLGTIIVPSKMPIHYTIKLCGANLGLGE